MRTDDAVQLLDCLNRVADYAAQGAANPRGGWTSAKCEKVERIASKLRELMLTSAPKDVQDDYDKLQEYIEGDE
jgi:hypothetical protein